MSEHSHSLHAPLFTHSNADLTSDASSKIKYSNWLEGARHYQQNGEPFVIATVVAEVGSTPRDNGAKMVIGLERQFDTLGGGNLEFQVIQQARLAISEGRTGASVERFSLAADLGQCCGGAAQVLLEFMQTDLPQLVIFGAGHVCQALTKIVTELPCRVTVIDRRPEWLEPLQAQGIRTQLLEDAAECINALSPKSHIVIMTHDHSLDFELTKHALERNCFAFIGLIGSMGKKQRFTFRLKEQLSDPQLLEQLTCPIGHPQVAGKLPMQVAVSISAQLIPLFAKAQSCSTTPASTETEVTLLQPKQSQSEHRWEQANALRKTLHKPQTEATK